MTAGKTIHIILINYKTWQHTIDCLKSIANDGYENKKVWIVVMEDEGSEEEKIKDHLQESSLAEVKIICIPKNLGFAGGNNYVLKKILDNNECGYTLLLNNDVTLKENTLSTFVTAWEKLSEADKHPGIIGPKLLETDGNNTIQSVGGIFDPAKGLIKLLGQGEPDRGQYDGPPVETDFVIGAAMFFSTDVLKQIGLMDERYFLYCEDLDWCISARNEGYQIYVCPSIVLNHEQGVSTGVKYTNRRQKSATLKYLHGSYLKFYRKNFPDKIIIARLQLSRLLLSKLLRGNIYEAILIQKLLVHNILGKL